MKRNYKIWGFQISLLVLLLTFGLQQTADAQTRPKSRTTKTTKKKTDDYFDESGGFKHRLMYGVQADQGFLSLFGSDFHVGFDPLIGYKVTNWAALGIVTGLRYDNVQLQQLGTGRLFQYSAFTYSYGAFARVKPIKQGFVHFEYRNVSFDKPLYPDLTK
jgi:hypothetical protein